MWYLLIRRPGGRLKLAKAHVAPVRFEQILPRSDRNDTRGVNRFMATEIVVTNMVHINSFSNARYLIDIAQETVQIQVVADSVFVAFEMSHVNRIKAYQGRP